MICAHSPRNGDRRGAPGRRDEVWPEVGAAGGGRRIDSVAQAQMPKMRQNGWMWGPTGFPLFGGMFEFSLGTYGELCLTRDLGVIIEYDASG